MNDTFSAYLPFNKFEENPDGTLTVFGRATQEVRDSANEVMDYQTSVPFFKERSQENSIRSAGQNLMPLRSMHQNNAAGKVVQFDYLDSEKAIDIATLVVDPVDILKVKTGVYTGFSVGGKYARRWADGGSMRYTADPREISLVDTPAVPTAKLTLFKVDLGKGESEGHPFRGNQWTVTGGENPEGRQRAIDKILEFYVEEDEDGNAYLNEAAAKEGLGTDWTEDQKQEIIDEANYSLEGGDEEDDSSESNSSDEQMSNRVPTVETTKDFETSELMDYAASLSDDELKAKWKETRKQDPSSRLTDAFATELRERRDKVNKGEIHSEKAPKWVSSFTEAVTDLKKIKQVELKEREELFTKMKTLGERMGIQKRADSPLVPPKDFPNNPLEYGDPANYKYPVTKDLVVDTVERFNEGLEKYSPSERHLLGRRITLLGNQFGDFIYLPELSKIERKENIMSDKLAKMDVGAIVAGLKGQAASSASLANSDPQAAVTQLLSYIDGLTQGQPISGQNVPVQDPSKALSKGEVPPQFKAKAAPAKAVPEEEETPEDEASETPAEQMEEEGTPPETYLKLEAKVEALQANVTALVEALTKRVTPKVEDSPVGALNSLVKKDVNALEGLDETEAKIIQILDEGGPYALVKALEVAGAGEPNGGGALAWQRYNNAIRKASHVNLEKGGVITASRYVGKLYG